MATRPPILGVADRMDERVVRAILPRPVDRARAGGAHHVSGRRPRRAANGGDQVEEAAVADDLRSFRRKALDVPFGRIMPGIVDMLWLADGREAVVRQAHPVAP